MTKPLGEAGAGFWGDYNCDLPNRTFTAMVLSISCDQYHHLHHYHQNPDTQVEQIAKTEEGKIDYLIYTGDAPAHDVWLQVILIIAIIIIKVNMINAQQNQCST